MALFINSRPVNSRTLHNQTLTPVYNKSSKKMTPWGRCWIFSCLVMRGGEISVPHHILMLCLPPSPISLPLEFPEKHNKMRKFEEKVIGKRWFLLIEQLLLLCHGGLVAKLCPALATPWTVAWVLRAWDSPGKNTAVGCHFLLQRIFQTQESNVILLYCR